MRAKQPTTSGASVVGQRNARAPRRPSIRNQANRSKPMRAVTNDQAKSFGSRKRQVRTATKTPRPTATKVRRK